MADLKALCSDAHDNIFDETDDKCVYNTTDNKKIYDVALYTYKQANISGIHDKTECPYGRRYGNYGCGDQPQVTLNCLITDSEGYNASCEIDDILPAKLFVDKKEGDLVEVPHNNGVIYFRMNQTHHKNREPFGCEQFEDVFCYIIANSIKNKDFNICKPSYFTPEVSKDAQIQMFKDFAALVYKKE